MNSFLAQILGFCEIPLGLSNKKKKIFLLPTFFQKDTGFWPFWPFFEKKISKY
jgi:hypothetical protein